MKKAISIGIQGFSDLREQDCFFVDKTNFIKEWWGKPGCCNIDHTSTPFW